MKPNAPGALRLPGIALLRGSFRLFAVCEREGARIDLILTGVVMPKMNGQELAARLAVLWPTVKVL